MADPKRHGISFDDLEAADMAVVMSQLNSEPRPSMAFMPPLSALLAVFFPLENEDGPSRGRPANWENA